MESICVQHKVKLHLTNIYNNIEFKIGTSWHQKELKEVHYYLGLKVWLYKAKSGAGFGRLTTSRSLKVSNKKAIYIFGP